MAVHPTKEQVECLLAHEDLDRPVVMLNLLRFAEQADDDGDHDGMSGQESYRRYGDRVQSILAKTGGRILWQGRGDSVVIGDDDADDWDMVILVEYPSRRKFIEMTSSPEYREVGTDRTAGLADSRLVAMTELTRGL